MATAWQSYRSGAFDRTSNYSDSPWYDNGVQTALASYPFAAFATDSCTIGSFAITAPSVVVSGTGTVTISGFSGSSLTLGSSAFTCGAITLSGSGALTSGAGLLTCTSITTTTGAFNSVTIGAGGATFAGVINNIGTGTLTINGAVTGVTNLTVGNCNQNASIAMTGTLVGPGTGQTWTQESGANLTGFSASVASFAGTWNVGAATVQGNSAAALTINVGGFLVAIGTINATGTSGVAAIFSNANTSYNCNLTISANNAVMTLTNADISGFVVAYSGGIGGYITLRNVHIVPVNITGAQSMLQWSTSYPGFWDIDTLFLEANLSNFGGFSGAGGTSPAWPIRNVAIGYNRSGASKPLTRGIAVDGGFVITNCVVNATTPISNNVGPAKIVIDNYGYLPSSMVAAASALASAVAAAGIGYVYTNYGVCVRNTSHVNGSETYCWECTPGSLVNALRPLDWFYGIPVTTGDVVTVAGSAQRSSSNLSASAASVIFDLEGAYSTSSTNVLTLGTGYGTFSYNSGTVTGTGTMRIIHRVSAYYAGAYVDWGKLTITVTHTGGSTSTYSVNYSNSM